MSVSFVDERDDPLPEAPWVRLAEVVLAGEAVPPNAEVALMLVDVAAMTELNRAHMGNEGPTDVLSFPLEDATPGSPPAATTGGPPPLLGDVVICPDVVRTQAEAAGSSFEDELSLMVVHGLLHLLGYDHVADDEAERMEERERSYLAAVGRRRR